MGYDLQNESQLFEHARIGNSMASIFVVARRRSLKKLQSLVLVSKLVAWHPFRYHQAHFHGQLGRYQNGSHTNLPSCRKEYEEDLLYLRMILLRTSYCRLARAIQGLVAQSRMTTLDIKTLKSYRTKMCAYLIHDYRSSI
jgi:hypothetical protein